MKFCGKPANQAPPSESRPGDCGALGPQIVAASLPVSDVREVGHVLCDADLLNLSLSTTLERRAGTGDWTRVERAALFSNLNLYPISTHT